MKNRKIRHHKYNDIFIRQLLEGGGSIKIIAWFYDTTESQIEDYIKENLV